MLEKENMRRDPLLSSLFGVVHVVVIYFLLNFFLYWNAHVTEGEQSLNDQRLLREKYEGGLPYRCSKGD
jgi:hypothetical protein